MEKRATPRFPFRMQAFLQNNGTPRAFETRDLSAGGAFLVGDPGCDAGAVLGLRLELETALQGMTNVYPLDARLQVVRVEREDGGPVTGFGASWVWVECRADIAPLREFLRHVLKISAGFVQALRPRESDGQPTFTFVFPRLGTVREGPEVRPAEAAETPAPAAPAPAIPAPAAAAEVPAPLAAPAEAPPAEAPTEEVPDPARKPATGTYVMLPVTYATDEGEFPAEAVKLRSHGMRLVTTADPPDAYRRVTVRVPVAGRDKPSFLSLVGTVVTVRRGGGDHQFDFEFSLGNEPDALASYRRMVDQALQSAQGTRGF